MGKEKELVNLVEKMQLSFCQAIMQDIDCLREHEGDFITIGGDCLGKESSDYNADPNLHEPAMVEIRGSYSSGSPLYFYGPHWTDAVHRAADFVRSYRQAGQSPKHYSA